MLNLKCCRCGEEFIYTVYIVDFHTFNTFDKVCNTCRDKNRLKLYLNDNNVFASPEQFEVLYIIYKQLKEIIKLELINANK